MSINPKKRKRKRDLAHIIKIKDPEMGRILCSIWVGPPNHVSP